jgi:hypothetical protein
MEQKQLTVVVSRRTYPNSSSVIYGKKTLENEYETYTIDQNITGKINSV